MVNHPTKAGTACSTALQPPGMREAGSKAHLRGRLMEAQQRAKQHPQALLQGTGIGPQVGLVHGPVDGVQLLLPEQCASL